MTARFCHNCGQPLAGTGRFCVSCGAPSTAPGAPLNPQAGVVTAPALGQPEGQTVPEDGATLQELEKQRPKSHEPNILPKGYLSAGEISLFETHPSLTGFVVVPGIVSIVGGLTLIILGFLLSASGQVTGVPPQMWDLYYGVGAVLIILVIPTRILLRQSIVYAITTSRMVTKTGWSARRISEIPLSALQSVSITESGLGRVYSYGNLKIASASAAGTAGGGVFHRPGVINWLAIPFPVETRAFCELVEQSVQGRSDTLGRWRSNSPWTSAQ